MQKRPDVETFFLFVPLGYLLVVLIIWENFHGQLKSASLTVGWQCDFTERLLRCPSSPDRCLVLLWRIIRATDVELLCYSFLPVTRDVKCGPVGGKWKATGITCKILPDVFLSENVGTWARKWARKSSFHLNCGHQKFGNIVRRDYCVTAEKCHGRTEIWASWFLPSEWLVFSQLSKWTGGRTKKKRQISVCVWMAVLWDIKVTDEHVVKAGETEIARKRSRKRGVDFVRKSSQSSTVHLFFFQSNDIVATRQSAGSFTWTPSAHEKNKQISSANDSDRWWRIAWCLFERPRVMAGPREAGTGRKFFVQNSSKISRQFACITTLYFPLEGTREREREENNGPIKLIMIVKPTSRTGEEGKNRLRP